MIKLLSILWNSFKMALQELRVNKLRTFLSLFGVTIGIFCIIGVLATVDSLKRQVKKDIDALGNNTIYIDKWDYAGGNDYPWWKFINRPEPTYNEMRFLKSVSELSANMSFFVSNSSSITNGDNVLNGGQIYGVTDEFKTIQILEIEEGRYLSDKDFNEGTPTAMMGFSIAEKLFGKPAKAVGKEITFNGKKASICGILKKQGSGLGNGFNYDESIVITYKYFANIYVPKNSSPFIMVSAKEGITTAGLSDELRSIMRRMRRLSPTEDDDFSLNDVNVLGDSIKPFFTQVNIGGWAIAGLSLIVGAFGVANIMFVTVRERTSQIGLKKAIGAKRSTILTEFLLESAFLCIIGGLIGLGLVWLLAQAVGGVLPFPIFIAPNIVGLALSICILLGILSGIIPASIAAKMDPVVAIRTK
jgi:putative ABC transport system permease protein